HTIVLPDEQSGASSVNPVNKTGTAPPLPAPQNLQTKEIEPSNDQAIGVNEDRVQSDMAPDTVTVPESASHTPPPQQTPLSVEGKTNKR
ncbi:hypothetical protein U9M48_026235, partial [Paspalum notatum var. saurae]